MASILFLTNWLVSPLTVHSKNSRVRFDPEKESEGARPILGSDLPGIQVRLTRNPGQTDPES